MNKVVATSIAAQAATLTREVEVSVDEDLGYGRDLWCLLDLAEDYRDVDPKGVEAISQALIRRSITPRGSLIDDANYGFDVRGYCNRGVTNADLRMLAGQLRSEYLKDDRVDEVSVVVTVALQLQSLSIAAAVSPADPDVAIFDLTFAVTDSEVLDVTITGAGAGNG